MSEDDADERDEREPISDPDLPNGAIAGLHLQAGVGRPFGPMFGSFGALNARRCSFCDRNEGSVDRLVRGRGAYICDRCVSLAADAIGDPKNENTLIRLKPRPALPADRVAAEEAIERSYETVLGGDASDVQRCEAIEAGDDLSPTMREVKSRYPARDQVDVSIEYVRFIDENEAEVGYALILPGQMAMPGMHMPSKGYAVKHDGRWKMARTTYAELVGRLGITIPPRDG